eukprot:14587949-Heterocapsa_arctica.AAC.1
MTFVEDGWTPSWCPRLGAMRRSTSGVMRCTPGSRARGAGRRLVRTPSGQEGRTRAKAPRPSPTSGRGAKRRISAPARGRT